MTKSKSEKKSELTDDEEWDVYFKALVEAGEIHLSLKDWARGTFYTDSIVVYKMTKAHRKKFREDGRPESAKYPWCVTLTFKTEHTWKDSREEELQEYTLNFRIACNEVHINRKCNPEYSTVHTNHITYYFKKLVKMTLPKKEDIAEYSSAPANIPGGIMVYYCVDEININPIPIKNKCKVKLSEGRV